MDNEKKKSKGTSEKKGPGVMNVILIIVGISLFAFTIAMIQLFKEYGMVPDTLVTCVFAALGGECGIMGWIKTSKDRNKERKWEVEDREHSEEMMEKQNFPSEISEDAKG